MLAPQEPEPVQPAPAPRPSSKVKAGGAERAAQRRPLALIAVGLAAILVITVGLGAWQPWASRTTQLATSARTDPSSIITRVSAAGQPAAVTPVTTALPSRTPTAAAHKDSVAHAAAPAPAPTPPPATDAVAPAPDILPAAPKLDLKGAVADVKVSQDISKFEAGSSGPTVSPTVLVSHYTAANAAAGSDLEDALNASNVTALFAKDRLSSADGIEKARHSIESSVSAIRQWRARTGNIERAYQDTLLQIQRNRKTSPEELRAWAGRSTQQEGKETAELVDLMLGQAENVFDLLSAQDGKYSFSGDAIKFNDGEASRRYGTLRIWLAQKSDAWAQTPESAIPVTLRHVLKAISKPPLPQEK
jgi:hypothetical protein